MLALVLAVAGAAVLAADYAAGTQREEKQAFPGNVEYDGRLVFVRIRYNSGFGGGGFQSRGSRGEPPWAHDYPTADTHLMRILKELSVANPLVNDSNVFTLDDPDLLDYPIAYMSEPGYWTMSDEEMKGLRVLPAEGRVHHLRRLPVQPLVQPRRADEEGSARGALGDPDAGGDGVQLVLRDQELQLRLLRQGNLLRHLRGQRPEQAAPGDCRAQPGSRRVLGILGRGHRCRSTCRTRRTSSA